MGIGSMLNLCWRKKLGLKFVSSLFCKRLRVLHDEGDYTLLFLYIFVQQWWYNFSTLLWEHLILQEYSYFLISQNFLILHWNDINATIIFRVQAGWGVSVHCPSGLLCAHPRCNKTEVLPQDMSVFITRGSWTLPVHALLHSGFMLAC